MGASSEKHTGTGQIPQFPGAKVVNFSETAATYPQKFALYWFLLLTLHQKYTLTDMDVRIDPQWKERLADAFGSDWFAQLADHVRAEYNAPGHVYPPAGEIFAAFDACPFADVKVVIIGQDPYRTGRDRPTGYAFRCVREWRCLLRSSTYSRRYRPRQAHLSSRRRFVRDGTRQGVLLLNSSLTVREHQPKSHSGLGWERLTDTAVHRLAEEREGIVFYALGIGCHQERAFIDRGRHLVLTSLTRRRYRHTGVSSATDISMPPTNTS